MFEYFSFRGTVGRRDYWLTTFVYLVALLVSMVFFINESTLGLTIGLLIAVPVTIMSLALNTKRIRDTGCSGWFILVYGLIGFIPYAGIIAQVIWMCLPQNFLHRYLK